MDHHVLMTTCTDAVVVPQTALFYQQKQNWWNYVHFMTLLATVITLV